jgi:hypothetical protein
VPYSATVPARGTATQARYRVFLYDRLAVAKLEREEVIEGKSKGLRLYFNVVFVDSLPRATIVFVFVMLL